MAFREEHFIYAKTVDKSLLLEGVTFPTAILDDFKAWFGELAPGTSRDITIRLNGRAYAVRIGNRNFDRAKWPTHPEMYQMRYTSGGEFAQALRRCFQVSHEFIEKVRAERGMPSRKHVDIPVEKTERLLFYRTENPLVWDAEVQNASETADAVGYIRNVDEIDFESAAWTDQGAGLFARPAVTKIRRLDRMIGNNLKRIYSHRCQICGEQVAETYGTVVDEVHHIEPFVKSLNNDVSNLMVLCPNHHRVIHAARPVFVRRDLSFRYGNGLVEGLRLNLHLRAGA